MTWDGYMKCHVLSGPQESYWKSATWICLRLAHGRFVP